MLPGQKCQEVVSTCPGPCTWRVRIPRFLRLGGWKYLYGEYKSAIDATSENQCPSHTLAKEKRRQRRCRMVSPPRASCLRVTSERPTPAPGYTSLLHHQLPHCPSSSVPTLPWNLHVSAHLFHATSLFWPLISKLQTSTLVPSQTLHFSSILILTLLPFSSSSGIFIFLSLPGKHRN